MNEENLKRLKSWMSENKHSQQEIADRMGVSQAYVNQLLNGLSKFGKRTALTWRDEFGFNPKWLLYEEEPMFTYEEEDPEHISKNLYNNKNDENLFKQVKVAPLVPIDITRQQNVRVWDYMNRHKDVYDTIPDRLMPNFDLIHTVRSNVLAPAIEKGDVLFLQHLELSTDSVVNGHIYFIDTKKNGIVIKKVYINDGKLQCFSLSGKIAVKSFDIDEIYDIFSVVAMLKFSIYNNDNTESKERMLDKMIDSNKEIVSQNGALIQGLSAHMEEITAQRKLIERLIK